MRRMKQTITTYNNIKKNRKSFFSPTKYTINMNTLADYYHCRTEVDAA